MDNRMTRTAGALGIAAWLVASVAMLGSGAALAGPPKTKMDKPTISCAGATQASLYVQVCAGATGAPAGFSLQWMKQADLVAAGGVWPSSEEMCHASFSGNANLSRYNLRARECVMVNVGEFLFDNGASTNCENALDCGTDYVFRAFSHANSALMRSEFTANLTCGTLPCGHEDSCTYTQGYWKSHGPVPLGQNSNEWPVKSLTLGTVSYSDVQLLSILNAPAAGNGLISLAHQLIAAKLNVANLADDTAVAAAIAAADALIGGKVVPPVGSDSLTPGSVSALVDALAKWNEGQTGPGHCGDEPLPEN